MDVDITMEKCFHKLLPQATSRICFHSCFHNLLPQLLPQSASTAAPTRFQLKIMEAMHILWEQPSLNSQSKHLNLSLSY